MLDISDLIGVNYKVHGRNKIEGFDCYGLVIEIMKRLGIDFPDVFYSDTQTVTNEETAKEIFSKGLPLELIEKPRENDIIFLSVHGIPSHCGVYLGNDRFIHASYECGVCIDTLSRWRKRVVGFYRVKE